MKMKVKHLINLLCKADPDSEVILQGDPEGNHYGGIHGVAIGEDLVSIKDLEPSSPDPYDESVTIIVPSHTIYP